MTTQEAAKALGGISESRVRQLCRAGRLKGKQTSRRGNGFDWNVSAASVTARLAKNGKEKHGKNHKRKR